MKKKLLLAITALVITFFLFSCGQAKEETSSKLKIYASLFPQYDMAKSIAGEKADVTLLLPPGTEAHDYDPSPADIASLSSGDMFIFTGEYMEPWAKSVADSLDNVYILDVSSGINLAHEEDHEEPGEEHHHEYDPHIWTSPKIAVKMADNIFNALSENDPENAEYYEERYNAYVNQLKEIDRELTEAIDSKAEKVIYHGGRFSLYYMARDYGFTCVSAFETCSSESEPSAKSLADLIKVIKEKKVDYIFIEELSDPKTARAIKDETGAEMLLLHSCHNVSQKDFDSGVTYCGLMKQNIDNIRKGML